MKSPLPSVNEAYHALLEEERQREITCSMGINSDSSAMAVYNKKFQHNFNNNRGQYTSGQKNNGYKGQTIKMNNYYCDHCRCPGHSTERCYKLNGYPPNYKYNNNINNGKGKKVVAYCHNEGTHEDEHRNTMGSSQGQGMINQDQYNHIMDLINKQNLGNSTSTTSDNTPSAMLAGKSLCSINFNTQFFWILDSGATDHIIPQAIYLPSLTIRNFLVPNNYISTANGHREEIKHVGDVRLTPDITLHNVLHVPEFHFNLISINKISSDLCCDVSFSSTLGVIQGPSMNKPLLLGKYKNGLYPVDPALMICDEKQNTKTLSSFYSSSSRFDDSVPSPACKDANHSIFVPKNTSCNVSHTLNEKGDALL